MIKDFDRLNHKVIAADIFETEQIFQTVFVYLTEIGPRLWEAEIRMPLMITPSDIHTDVFNVFAEEVEIGSFLLDPIKYTLNLQLI